MPAYRKKCNTGLRITEELAWLLGMLAADGGLTTYGTVNVFPGLDQKLAERVASSIKLLFGIEPRVWQKKEPKRDWVVTANSSNLHDEVTSLGKFGLTEWTVPERVKEADERIKGAWLRGFFDGDGCAHNAEAGFHPGLDYKVACSSVNQEAMKDVSALLLSIGIQHGWGVYSKGEQRQDSTVISITHHADLFRFRDLVGFHSEDKAAKLEDSCKFKRKIARHGSIVVLTPEIEKLRRQGLPIAEVAGQLGLCEGSVNKAIHKAGLAGEIPRIGHAQAKLPEILALQAQGLSFWEIADRLGLTDKQTVNGVLIWARRRGLAPVVVHDRGRKLAEAAAALRAKDWTWSEIAQELETDPSTAHKAVRLSISRGWLPATALEALKSEEGTPS